MVEHKPDTQQSMSQAAHITTEAIRTVGKTTGVNQLFTIFSCIAIGAGAIMATIGGLADAWAVFGLGAVLLVAGVGGYLHHLRWLRRTRPDDMTSEPFRQNMTRLHNHAQAEHARISLASRLLVHAPGDRARRALDEQLGELDASMRAQVRDSLASLNPPDLPPPDAAQATLEMDPVEDDDA